MKKCLTFILTILLIASALALEIQSDDEFKQASTFLAKLEGNILESIPEENIGFYEAHVQIPFTHGFTKIEDTYYIYAILPYKSGEYNLKIEDVYFKENNQYLTQTLEKTFTITNQTADFNINPGAITAKDNFTISLYNNLNSDLEITYELANNSEITTLPLQESSTLIIFLDNLEEKLNTLKISSESTTYEMPVYSREKITKRKTPINDSEEKVELRFALSSLSDILNKNETYIQTIEIKNLGEKDAEEINFSVSKDLEDYLTISKTSIPKLNSLEKYELDLILSFDKIGIFEGELLADSEDSQDTIKLSFEVGENLTNVRPPSEKLSCSKLKGTICVQGQTCDGNYIPSSDQSCCIGTCKKLGEKPKREINWTALIIIFILLIIIIGAIIWQLKRQKPKAKDILEKRKQSYSKRFEMQNKLKKS